MRPLALLATIALAGSLLVGCAQQQGTTPETAPPTTTESSPGTAPEGGVETSPAPGGIADPAALVNDRCTNCHDLERVKAANKDRARWDETIQRMRQNGAQLTDEEARAVSDFLAAGGAEKL